MDSATVIKLTNKEFDNIKICSTCKQNYGEFQPKHRQIERQPDGDR